MAVKEFGWLSEPLPEHLVQFYQSDGVLLTTLSEYVRCGLERQDTCVVIATPSHLRSLDASLSASGMNPDAARQSGQYITVDATATLDQLMAKGLPARTHLSLIFQSMVRKAAERNKPIRLYGEMVALLWKDGKKDAVMQFEELWHELVEEYAFSLLCAYPDLHFIMDNDVRTEIRQCHHASLPSFTAEQRITSPDSSTLPRLSTHKQVHTVR